MSEISRGCPSSGWVLALTAGHPKLARRISASRRRWRCTGRTATSACQAGRFRPATRSRRTAATSSAAPGTTPPAATMRPIHGQRHRPRQRPTASHLAADRPRRLLDRRQLGRDRSARDRLEARRLRERVRARAPDDPGGRHDRRAVARDGARTRTRLRGRPLLAAFLRDRRVAVGVARGAIDVYEDVLRSKPIDIPPFTLRGETASTSTTSARRSASSTSPRPRCSRGRSGTSSRRSERSRPGQPAGRGRRGDTAAAAARAAVHPARGGSRPPALPDRRDERCADRQPARQRRCSR